jgi:hypothetical protein
MRAWYLIAALPIALPAMPASAQERGDFTLQGRVNLRCVFLLPSAAISLGELARGGSGASAGKLDTSRVNGQTRELLGFCNSAASEMTVEAQPLVNVTAQAAPPGGFDRRVDYVATATVDDVDATDQSADAGAGPGQNVGRFIGRVAVTLSDASTPNSGILVAGAYQGQVLVTLNPLP